MRRAFVYTGMQQPYRTRSFIYRYHSVRISEITDSLVFNGKFEIQIDGKLEPFTFENITLAEAFARSFIRECEIAQEVA